MTPLAALLPPAGTRWRAWRGPLVAGAALLALAASAAWFTYWVSLNTAVHDLQASAVRRLDSVAAALDSTLARFDYLPALLETTPAVMELLARPGDPTLRDRANRTLVRINAIAAADMLFVLDADGDAQAADDWDKPATTVGHNYSYRPYMRDALLTGRGRFFGVGATSRLPGYFLSYALRNGERTLGVATVKVNLEAAERVWAARSRLPSAPSWREKSPMPPTLPCCPGPTGPRCRPASILSSTAPCTWSPHAHCRRSAGRCRHWTRWRRPTAAPAIRP